MNETYAALASVASTKQIDWSIYIFVNVLSIVIHIQGHVVMGNNAISPYQQVIEKTKSLSFRSQLLAMNIEKKQAHSSRNEVSNTHTTHEISKHSLPGCRCRTPLTSSNWSDWRSTRAQCSSKLLKWSAQKNKAKECWWTTINKSSLDTKTSQ